MLLENKSEYSSEEINNETLKSTEVETPTEYDDNNNKQSVSKNDLMNNDELDENGRFNFEQSKKDYGTDLNFKREIVWKNAIGFAIVHIIGLSGFVLFFTHAKLVTSIYVYILAFLTGQGITAGAHRLWAHRTYKARLPLKIFLLIVQTMNGQNCLWVWVRDHRQHHRYSDTDADPHNARRGFFFSHIGWLMSKKHPLVKEVGKTIDMSDLEADSWVMFQKRYYKTLYFIFAFLIPVLIPIVLWNEKIWVSVILSYFTRYVYLLNVTWSVNSFAHMHGTKPYDESMLPIDNKILAFFTIGEGWHNFHHTFPWDYRTGEWGGLYNRSLVFINFMHYIGQAYDLKMASPAMIKKRMERTGDGTIYEHIHLKTISKQL